MKKQTLELFNHDKGFAELVGGCDEAGRGPLAGPVVAAICIMPLVDMIDGINDSKAISKTKREALYELIVKNAIAYSVGVVDEKTIDEINILNADKLAMKIAYNDLKIKPQLLLVDAVTGLDIPCKTRSIVHGDALSYNIAAASIIAKFTRDAIMKEADAKFPNYGFVHNQGYGTKTHIEALRQYGACDFHRKSFIKNFTGGDNEKPQ